MMRNILVGLVLLLSAACAKDLTPTQEANALLDAYLGVAKPALACVNSPACNEKIGDEVRAADAVAFSYTESVTLAAIAWAEAPEDDKPAKLSVFEKLKILGTAAVGKLAELL